MIMFASAEYAAEQDLTPVLNTTDAPWTEQINDDEQVRIKEIEQICGEVKIHGRDWEGFLVVAIPDAKADDFGVYEVFYVDKQGMVGTAMVNQPAYFLTMAELLAAKTS